MRPARVVRGGDAGRDPVRQPTQFAQPCGNEARRGSRLPFELHQIEFGKRRLPVHRSVGRRTSASVWPLKIEGETLDGAGTEVPAGDDAVRGDATERFGHRRKLLHR